MDDRKQLQDYFEEYINECQFLSRLRPETVRGYKSVFQLFMSIMPEVTSCKLLIREMLTTFFVRLQIRERLVGKRRLCTGVRDSTVKTYWSKLNGFFTWLFNKGLIVENPLRNLKPPCPAYNDIQTLGDHDIRKMYSAVALNSHNTLALRRDMAMLSLLLFCGLRLGEFISLEVVDIDFSNEMLIVRSETSKSKRGRQIPMHPTLQLHLRDYVAERNKHKYRSPSLIVSSKSDTGLSRHGLKHWVKALAEKSGVRFHLHQFRHAFACNLAKKDINAVKIQKLLGHGSLNMTMLYLRSLRPEDLREDINKLSI